MQRSDERLLKHLEFACSEYFKVSQKWVNNGDRRASATMARGFVMYIAHYHYDIPTSILAEFYLLTRRSVFWNIKKIKGLVDVCKPYKDMYEEICAKTKK